MLKYLSLILTLSCLPLLAAPVGWRMDGSSLFPTATPQTGWGTADHVVWATPLPQWSNSSPLLVGDRLFVTAEPFSLLCLDRAGKILWQRSSNYDDLLSAEERAKLAEEGPAYAAQMQKVNEAQNAVDEKRQQVKKAEDDAKAAANDATLADKVTALKAELPALETQCSEQRKLLANYPLAIKWTRPITHDSNGYASDTPTSDGQTVYATFGNGVVSAFALDGTVRWQRFVEKPTHGWGHSASPVLVGDLLVVQFVDTFGLDARTGEVRWQAKHPHIWGTPAPVRIGKSGVLLTDSGEILNPADGATLAKTDMSLEYGSPLVRGDIAYCVSGNTARAFQLTAGTDGAITVSKLWETPVRDNRYYASPLCYAGLLYVVNQGGILSVLDAATGAKAYEQALNLSGTCYSSPVLAGNVIIFCSDSGKSVVITPGREYKEISRPALESFRSTPLCDGAHMYIRTCNGRASKLYCIGE